MDKHFVILYTGQKLKKAKTWHDGSLKHSGTGTKAVLYDDNGRRLDTIHVKVDDIVIGEQLESDRYFILIEDLKKSDEQQTVAPILNIVTTAAKPSISTFSRARCAGLKRKNSGFMPPRVIKQPCVRDSQVSEYEYQSQGTVVGKQDLVPSQHGSFTSDMPVPTPEYSQATFVNAPATNVGRNLINMYNQYGSSQESSSQESVQGLQSIRRTSPWSVYGSKHSSPDTSGLFRQPVGTNIVSTDSPKHSSPDTNGLFRQPVGTNIVSANSPKLSSVNVNAKHECSNDLFSARSNTSSPTLNFSGISNYDHFTDRSGDNIHKTNRLQQTAIVGDRNDIPVNDCEIEDPLEHGDKSEDLTNLRSHEHLNDNAIGTNGHHDRVNTNATDTIPDKRNLFQIMKLLGKKEPTSGSLDSACNEETKQIWKTTNTLKNTSKSGHQLDEIKPPYHHLLSEDCTDEPITGEKDSWTGGFEEKGGGVSSMHCHKQEIVNVFKETLVTSASDSLHDESDVFAESYSPSKNFTSNTHIVPNSYTEVDSSQEIFKEKLNDIVKDDSKENDDFTASFHINFSPLSHVTDSDTEIDTDIADNKAIADEKYNADDGDNYKHNDVDDKHIAGDKVNDVDDKHFAADDKVNDVDDKHDDGDKYDTEGDRYDVSHKHDNAEAKLEVANDKHSVDDLADTKQTGDDVLTDSLLNKQSSVVVNTMTGAIDSVVNTISGEIESDWCFDNKRLCNEVNRTPVLKHLLPSDQQMFCDVDLVSNLPENLLNHSKSSGNDEQNNSICSESYKPVNDCNDVDEDCYKKVTNNQKASDKSKEIIDDLVSSTDTDKNSSKTLSFIVELNSSACDVVTENDVIEKNEENKMADNYSVKSCIVNDSQLDMVKAKGHESENKLKSLSYPVETNDEIVRNRETMIENSESFILSSQDTMELSLDTINDESQCFHSLQKTEDNQHMRVTDIVTHRVKLVDSPAMFEQSSCEMVDSDSQYIPDSATEIENPVKYSSATDNPMKYSNNHRDEIVQYTDSRYVNEELQLPGVEYSDSQSSHTDRNIQPYSESFYVNHASSRRNIASMNRHTAQRSGMKESNQLLHPQKQTATFVMDDIPLGDEDPLKGLQILPNVVPPHPRQLFGKRMMNTERTARHEDRQTNPDTGLKTSCRQEHSVSNKLDDYSLPYVSSARVSKMHFMRDSNSESIHDGDTVYDQEVYCRQTHSENVKYNQGNMLHQSPFQTLSDSDTSGKSTPYLYSDMLYSKASADDSSGEDYSTLPWQIGNSNYQRPQIGLQNVKHHSQTFDDEEIYQQLYQPRIMYPRTEHDDNTEQRIEHDDQTEHGDYIEHDLEHGDHSERHMEHGVHTEQSNHTECGDQIVDDFLTEYSDARYKSGSTISRDECAARQNDVITQAVTRYSGRSHALPDVTKHSGRSQAPPGITKHSGRSRALPVVTNHSGRSHALSANHMSADINWLNTDIDNSEANNLRNSAPNLKHSEDLQHYRKMATYKNNDHINTLQHRQQYMIHREHDEHVLDRDCQTQVVTECTTDNVKQNKEVGVSGLTRWEMFMASQNSDDNEIDLVKIADKLKNTEKVKEFSVLQSSPDLYNTQCNRNVQRCDVNDNCDRKMRKLDTCVPGTVVNKTSIADESNKHNQHDQEDILDLTTEHSVDDQALKNQHTFADPDISGRDDVTDKLVSSNKDVVPGNDPNSESLFSCDSFDDMFEAECFDMDAFNIPTVKLPVTKTAIQQVPEIDTNNSFHLKINMENTNNSSDLKINMESCIKESEIKPAESVKNSSENHDMFSQTSQENCEEVSQVHENSDMDSSENMCNMNEQDDNCDIPSKTTMSTSKNEHLKTDLLPCDTTGSSSEHSADSQSFYQNSLTNNNERTILPEVVADDSSQLSEQNSGLINKSIATNSKKNESPINDIPIHCQQKFDKRHNTIQFSLDESLDLSFDSGMSVVSESNNNTVCTKNSHPKLRIGWKPPVKENITNKTHELSKRIKHPEGNKENDSEKVKPTFKCLRLMNNKSMSHNLSVNELGIPVKHTVDITVSSNLSNGSKETLVSPRTGGINKSTYPRLGGVKTLGSPKMDVGSPSMGVGSPSMAVGSPNMAVGFPSFGIGSPNMAVGSPGMAVGSSGMVMGSLDKDGVTCLAVTATTSRTVQSSIPKQDQPYRSTSLTNTSQRFKLPSRNSPVMSNVSKCLSKADGGVSVSQTELRFPSKAETEKMQNVTRQVVIPATFPSVNNYKQIITAALTEYINTHLLETARRYHHALSKVDTSGYCESQTKLPRSGVNNPNPVCQCGVPSKMVCVKKEGRNCGRYFYACSANRNQQCKYFQWADESRKGGGTACTANSKCKVCDIDGLNQHMKTQHVPFYGECQIIKRTKENINKYFKAPKWVRNRGDNDGPQKKQTLLKLPYKGRSSMYAKDDIWVISHQLDFNPTQTFIARSTYYGPSSSLEVEIEPIAGYSPSNWQNGGLCHAIRATNASTELSCLDNIREHIQARSPPVLTHLINRKCENNDRNLASNKAFLAPSKGFQAPRSVSEPQGSNNIHLHCEQLDDLARQYIDRYTLNTDQSEALWRVANMFSVEKSPTVDNVLLIHGVFGAGKSYLLSVMVLFLVEVFHLNDSATPGQPFPWKLLISSTTNVAVDRILKGLLDLGFEDFVRVGSVKKIAKPVLPYSVHASGTDNQELKDLQEMLRSGELTNAEKSNVRQSIEKHRHGENKKKLGRVCVVGATCAACSLTCLNQMEFPLVMLDECSQMTEPASLLPVAKFGCQKLLLVGDPKQLDPTVQGCEAAHQYGLEQTLFDRLINMACIPTLLRTQYRCHPDISAISNSLFYGGMLQDGVTTQQRKPLLNILPTVCCYDVDNGTECCESFGSYYNEQEAKFVVFVLRVLLTAGIEPTCVGVITLYKSQMSRISDLLTGQGDAVEMKGIQVSTVDAFQGGERDIIILSTVRTDACGFIDNDKRMNVALTRAKNHLLIVGNVNNLSRNLLWGKVLQHCKSYTDGVQSVETAQTLLQNYLEREGGSDVSVCSQQKLSGVSSSLTDSIKPVKKKQRRKGKAKEVTGSLDKENCDSVSQVESVVSIGTPEIQNLMEDDFQHKDLNTDTPQQKMNDVNSDIQFDKNLHSKCDGRKNRNRTRITNRFPLLSDNSDTDNTDEDLPTFAGL